MFLMRWIIAEAMLDTTDEREGSQYFQEAPILKGYGNRQKIYGAWLCQGLFFRQHFASGCGWMVSLRYSF
jgi:hypothetical protein